MTNNETEDTPVTYVTTDEPTSRVYVSPAGTLLYADEAIGTWKRIGASINGVTHSFELLGTAARELGETLQTKFVRNMSINFETPSVKFTSMLWGISMSEVRRIRGYVPRKPLVHKGRKPTW